VHEQARVQVHGADKNSGPCITDPAPWLKNGILPAAGAVCQCDVFVGLGGDPCGRGRLQYLFGFCVLRGAGRTENNENRWAFES